MTDAPTIPDEAPDVEPEPPQFGRLVLTAEQRKAYLGRLADFELKLAALPDMQAAFVLAVLSDPTNYTEAARVAGYRFPNITSQKLLNKPRIAACLAAGETLREDRTMLTSERTLHELAILAFSDITDFTVDSKGKVHVKDGVPAYATRAISSIEYDMTSWVDKDGLEHFDVKTKIRLWSKNDALKMIAIYQKLLSDAAPAVAVDQSQHVHIHQHQHNTWQFGDDKLTF